MRCGSGAALQPQPSAAELWAGRGGQVRADVPTVVRAYLLGDNEVLKEHCAPEMMERLTAIIAAQQAQAPNTHPHPTPRLNP